MNIYDFLKQLNKIEPDKNYTLISKNKILGINEEPKGFIFNINILKQITFSVAFSLVLVVIIFGASFLFGNLYPNFSALNAGAIKAEADAIDFQIKLSKIIYETPQSSDAIINNILKNSNKNQNKPTTTDAILISTTTPTSTPNFSIEEVLEYLAK